MVKFTQSCFLAVGAFFSEATAQSFTTSCTGNALATPAPKNYRCGTQGILSNQTPLQQTVLTSADRCRDACLALRECISYSYNPTLSYCTLLSQNLVKQGLKRASTGTYFYNRHCFVTCLDKFTLEAFGPASASFNKGFAGGYFDSGPAPLFVNNPYYIASVFALSNTSDIYVVGTSEILSVNPNSLNQTPLIMNYTDSVAAGRVGVQCSITPKTTLSCSVQSAEGAELNIFSVSNSYLKFGDDVESGETPVRLYALPLDPFYH